MHNKYKISVLVPCLNAAETIYDCINSILTQQYDNIEIVVIDGLSTDRTIEKVYSLIDNVAHKIISEKDCGIYDAINKGIDAASGDYLIVLGSDDIFYNNAVLKRVFSAEFRYADIIYGNVILKSTNNEYDGKFNILKLLKKNICHQAIFYHKSVYEKLGKYDTKYKSLADQLFNIKCFESGDISIRYIDEIISIYNDQGFSSSYLDAAYCDDFTNNIKKYCSDDVLKYHFATKHIADISQRLAERDAQLAERDAQLAEILNSRSWKITKPLRTTINVISGLINQKKTGK